MTITSSHICAALRLRYPKESHALMFEVAPSTGGGTRYADAVAFGLWASHGHAIDGIEVKVSRSDFLNEMKQPEKSQPIFQFCNRWWLACPKDMVKPDELPPTWGLLEYIDGGTLRQKIKAPKLSPIKPTTGFFAAMMRRHAGRDEGMAEIAVRARLQSLEGDIRQRLEREYRHKHEEKIADAERGLQALERIKAETGIDLASYGSKDRLITAVKLVMSLNEGWEHNLKGLRNSAAAVLAAVDESGLVP